MTLLCSYCSPACGYVWFGQWDRVTRYKAWHLLGIQYSVYRCNISSTDCRFCPRKFSWYDGFMYLLCHSVQLHFEAQLVPAINAKVYNSSALTSSFHAVHYWEQSRALGAHNSVLVGGDFLMLLVDGNSVVYIYAIITAWCSSGISL